MPSISIGDGLSVSIDAELSPFSTLAKYAKELPELIASDSDLSRWRVLTLADPAVPSLDLGFSISKPVDLGNGAPDLSLGGDTGIHFEVITGKMFSPDVYGDNVAIPDGKCAVRLGVSATASPGLSVSKGQLSFGLDVSTGITVDSYRLFSADDSAPTVLDAVRTCLADLVLPVTATDLDALPEGGVVTLGGTGSLTLSADANLVAITNPLAALELPSPLPSFAVKQGASVGIGASWQLSGEFQLRVHRTDAARVRLGWYRKHSSSFTVTASAKASVTAGASSTDLFPKLITAISADAAADEEELKNAGLSASQTAAVEDAVRKAISRKLEVALAAEFGSLTSDEAAFLYECELDAMDEAARSAVDLALRGDLSGLAAPHRGITEVRSILTTAKTTRFNFRVNLLGIFNFASITKLALKGTVTWTPSTGELVILDEATASRSQIANVNFGPDEEKLRSVMAESFLITAAYRGSQTALPPPQFRCTHSYFRLDNSTSRDEMSLFVLALRAVALAPPPLPGDIEKFGRTTLNVEANYGDAATVALFLGDNGDPRSVAEYESRGRRAMSLLVPPDADDAFRLKPMLDDALWAQMKDLGQPNFGQLFPKPHVGAIVADYSAIRWWSDTMHDTAVLVARILRPGASNSAGLRGDLADHLKKVAGHTHPQFGQPWGLVAMYLASGAAIADGSITGPRFVFAPARPLAAAG